MKKFKLVLKKVLLNLFVIVIGVILGIALVNLIGDIAEYRINNARYECTE